MIAWQYIAEATEEATSGLEYDYFYERIDASDSTIRGYFSDLDDEGLIRENEDGNKEFVVERLSDAIERIESAIDGED
ncbi:hypothetical protein [Halorhabdus rudnickae]|uniref:hypothetical protein n=1 Tax=Halorhabdus rudnickae TaxID=1775544 RepID=UPI00108437CD|nr:hypothetical protein [Halorhabdus rudnickae]